MPTFVPSEVQIKNNPGLKVISASRVGGGYMVVANVAALATIDASVRVPGMVVRTRTPSQDWVLQSDSTTWLPSAKSIDNGKASRAINSANITSPKDVVNLYQTTNGTINGLAWERSFLGITNDRLAVLGSQSSLPFLSYGIDFDAQSPQIPNPGPSEVGGLFVDGQSSYIIWTNIDNYTENKQYSAPSANFTGGFATRATALVANGSPQDYIFVTSPSGQSIYFFLPTDPGGVLTNAIDLSGLSVSPGGICAGDQYDIWVANTTFSSIIKLTFGALADSVNPAVVAANITLPEIISSNLVYDGKYVWGVSPNLVYRIASDGTVDTVNHPGSAQSRVAFDGMRIWVTQNGFVRAYDPDTLREVFVYTQNGKTFGHITVRPDIDSDVFFSSVGDVAGEAVYRIKTNVTTRVQVPAEASGSLLLRGGQSWGPLLPGQEDNILTILSGVPTWLPKPTGSSINQYNTTTDLVAASPVMTEGQLVYVKTLRCYYQSTLDNLATSGLDILRDSSNSMSWVRLFGDEYTWQHQSDWWIDPVNGNDESNGSVGQAIKTPAEFFKRVNHKLKIDMTVNIVGDIDSNFPIDGTLEIMPDGNVDPQIIFTSAPTVTGSDTISTRNEGTPSLNQPRVYTTTGNVPQPGNLLRSSDSEYCWVLSSSPNYYLSPSTIANNVTGLPESISFQGNNNLSILQVSNFGRVRLKLLGGNQLGPGEAVVSPDARKARVIFKFANIGLVDCDEAYFAWCIISNGNFIGGGLPIAGKNLRFVGCLFQAGTFQSGGIGLHYCGSYGTSLTFTNPSDQGYYVLGSTFYNVSLTFTLGSTTYFFDNQCWTPVSGIQTALTVEKGSKLYLNSGVCGTGFTQYGLQARGGSEVIITDSAPTLTGNAGDLRMDDQTMHLPPPLNGGTLLGRMSLATWSDWQNNFQRSYLGLQYGTKLLIAQGATTNDEDVTSSGSFTITPRMRYLHIDTSSQPSALTVPSTGIQGQTHTIRDATGNAAVNNIVLNTGISYTIFNPFDWVTIRWSGTAWYVLDKTSATVASPTDQFVSSNYTVQQSDGDIFVTYAGTSRDITLPANPTSGERHTIKDADLSSSAHPFNIVGNGHNIEQFSSGFASTLTLNQDGDAVTLKYTGTNWSIV